MLVDFGPGALESLPLGDKILIRGIGVGLSFAKYPHNKLINMSPTLLKKLPIRRDKTKDL